MKWQAIEYELGYDPSENEEYAYEDEDLVDEEETFDDDLELHSYREWIKEMKL